MELEKGPSSPAQNSLWPLVLLGILASGYALLRSIRLSAAIDKDGTKTVHPQYYAAEKGHHVNSPIITDAPPSPPEHDNPNGGKDNTPPWKKKLEIIAAVIGAGLLIVNIFQMCATQQASNTAIKTMHIAYRPRVEIRGISTEQKLDQGKFRSSIDLANYGLVAAKNVRIFRFDNVSSRNQIAKLPYEELLDQMKTILPLPQTGGFAILSRTVPSPEQLQGLRTGTLVATVSILIVYEDDFPLTHHAEYCTLFTLEPFNGPPCPWPVQND